MFDIQQSQEYTNRGKQAQAAWDSAQSEEERTAISQQWNQEKAAYNYYSNSYNSQFKGAEGEGISDELRYDQQKFNLPLVKSLRRTYGDEVEDQELIDRWMTEQTYLDTNLTRLGIQASKLGELSDQQKEDFGLQYLTYEKIKATGEGSRDFTNQAADVLVGVGTDPTNLLGLGTFGIALFGKEGTKALTKEGIKKFFIKPAVKRGAIVGGIEGGIYTGVDDSFRQSIERDLSLQEGFDWGRSANMTLLGTAMGGTLGATIVKFADMLAPRVNKYKINKGLTNTQVTDILTRAAHNESSAVKFMTDNLGFSKEEAVGIINRQKAEGSSPEPYKSEDVVEQTNFQQLYDSIGTSQRTVLERMGLKRVADDIENALVDRDKIIGKYNKILNSHKKKVNFKDEGLAARYRANKPSNADEAEMFRNLKRANTTRARELYKSGIIDKNVFAKFSKNKGYIGRVWNTKKLATEKGAQEFADLIAAKTANKPKIEREKAVQDILEALTGKRHKPVEGRINTKWIREAAMDRDREVNRSTHAEFKRKVHGFTEEELDPFMLDFESRMKLVNHDLAGRLGFAHKFGANDERVVDLSNSLLKRGYEREADAVGEAYGLAAGVPHNGVFGSKVLKGRIEKPGMVDVVNKVNAAQTWKMYMSAIPNLPQVYVNGLTSVAGTQGLVRGALNSLKAPMKAIFKDPELRQVIQESGVLSELEMHKFLSEGLAHSRIFEKELKGPLGILNEPTKFLRAVGFMGVERMNRLVAATMGVQHARYLHKTYRKLAMKHKINKFQERKLKKFRKEMKQLGIDPDAPELTTEMLSTAANKFNNTVNFSNEFTNLPSYWHHPYGKLAFKFKSFMFHHSRFLKNKVIKPMRKGDVRPLLAYLGTSGPLGGAMLQLRETLSGQDYQENADELEWLINGIAFAGGAGLLFDMFATFTDKYGSTPYAVSTVAGPTAGTVADITSVVGDVVKDKDLEDTFEHFLNATFPFSKPITKLLF